MKVFTNIHEIPRFDKAVVTIGSFDGVHKAHKKLIQRVNQIADEIDGQGVIVTFHPHPRSIVFPNDASLTLLSTLEEKLFLFEKAGVKNVIVIPFTVEFSQISATEYIENFIIKTLNPFYLIVGYDHKFGLARRGDFNMLKMYEKENKFRLIEIEKQFIEDESISSTNIRKSLLKSDFVSANQLIDDYYLVMGKVVKGDSIGRTIGYPTANVQIQNSKKLLPNSGIYACYVNVGKSRFEGMLYIGPRPTIDNLGKNVFEVNIFDFNDNIYEEVIAVEIVKKVREDQKFNSLDELKLMLDQDLKNVREILKEQKEKVKNNSIVTISILNYNGKSYLEEYLPALMESISNQPVSIAVIDNASSDDSVSFLKQNYRNIDIIQLSQNYGFAGGYNKGNHLIDSKYLLLLNSDIKVEKEWLQPLIDFIEANDTVAAVMPKIKSVSSPDSFEYAGACGGFLDQLGYPYCRGRIFDTVEKDNNQYNDAVPVFWTSGAAMLVRKELFENFGGFDSDFFAHQEEIDFCWRLRDAGYTCYVVPASVVYHVGGGTLSYDSPRKTYLNFRNNLATIIKNEKFPFFIFIFTIRLFLDGLAGIKFLMEGKFNHTFSIIKAHLITYFRILPLMLKRKKNFDLMQKYSIRSKFAVKQRPFSILIEYYLKGNKTFSKIFNK